MGKQKYNWQEIKQEFITANLAPGGKGLELKELAHKYGIPMNVLWKRSSKEGWIKELGQAVKEKNDEVLRQVQKDAVAIDLGELMKEYRVRGENYEVLNKVLGKLLKRWDSLTDEEFEEIAPPDLIKGILACLKAREQAAGLPRVFTSKETLDISGNPGGVSAKENTLTQAKKAEMAQKLSEFIELKKDEGAIDV